MIVKRSFIREKAFDARNSRYKEVELFEYSEEEQEAVRRKRKARSRASPPKIKNLNDSNSRKHFRWLFFNNFCEGDYHIVLTYDDEHLRRGIPDCKREFSNYIRCMKRLYIKKGLELRYLYVIEGTNDGARFHYHLIVNSGKGKVTRGEVEQLWKCAKRTNSKSLQFDDDGTFTSLVNYLMKSQDSKKKWERSWNCSQNLKRPEITVDDNKVSKRTMRRIREAARNDEVRAIMSKVYPKFKIIDYEIGQNPVTGRDYARFRMIRLE
ncbi:MAG TPA: hypothetical protein DHW32_10305 [Ruminococcaceae bacterium]|nr:hypothetical protein [Oscillospiraceae bacterium]HCK51112.1 hypothetical protein [Oscillospiraceae bacterium]